jgi:type I restriction enzyme S subunit
MSEWKELKIEEFCEVVGGGTPSTKEDSYYGGDISWITPRDLTNHKNRFISRGERNITELGLKNSSARILPKNSILLTSRAPIGYLAIAENEVCTNQGFKSLIVDAAKADYNFVYYLIKSNVEIIKGLGTGTTFAEISGSVVKGLKFTIPDLHTQTAIAEILSSLDDKIELNNKINQELENLAQTLFKQWFIDFEFPNENGKPYKSSGGEMVESELGEIPKGWEVERLGDHLYIKGRIGWKGLKKTEYLKESEGYSIVNGSDFLNEQIDYNTCGWIPKNRYEDSPEIQLKQNDILITKDGTIGKLAFVNKLEHPTSVASGIFVVRANSKNVSTYFCWSFFKSSYFQNLVKSRIDGSVIPHLYQKDFVEMFIPLPSSTLLEEFESQAKSIFELVFKNKEESKALSKLRDTILPKLISGELEVSQTQITA